VFVLRHSNFLTDPPIYLTVIVIAVMLVENRRYRKNSWNFLTDPPVYLTVIVIAVMLVNSEVRWPWWPRFNK
jgi:hypothetical protein